METKIDAPISIIERGPEERIECHVTEFKGKTYIHIRTYYLDLNDDSWKPTKKGISVPVEQFDDLKEMIKKAEGALNK